MSIACAKCHNHPLEKWTNDQYYQMANLFRARPRQERRARRRKHHLHRQPGRPGAAVARQAAAARAAGRHAVADGFAGRPPRWRWPIGWFRATIRISAAPLSTGFGPTSLASGLVENVDDLRATNPASDEKLLSAAARYLADHHFDLKSLMRAILQSETYQRSSKPLPENEADYPLLFALLSAPDDGRGVAGCDVASDRRFHSVQARPTAANIPPAGAPCNCPMSRRIPIF